MHLLRRVERHLRRHGIPATRFGREAMNDPSFVHSLRNGRDPRPETIDRVRAFLDQAERRGGGDSSCRR